MYDTNRRRLSELLPESSVVLPATPSSEDVGYDLERHKRIIYTMATCHSLRVVDDELLGDPLDVKMFQFTGWSYEEGGDPSELSSSMYDAITPSVARPPVSTTNTINRYDNSSVRNPEISYMANADYRFPTGGDRTRRLAKFRFVSQLRRASVIVRQFGDPGASFFVKGAPESVRDICLPETC